MLLSRLQTILVLKINVISTSLQPVSFLSPRFTFYHDVHIDPYSFSLFPHCSSLYSEFMHVTHWMHAISLSILMSIDRLMLSVPTARTAN